MDLSKIIYSVPPDWYDGVYEDKKECQDAARSFSLVHEQRKDECWLLIHGYRGYPGELVRPAVDLFEAGADVFVPRLPGHGTGGKDFEKSKGDDWLKLAENALESLKKDYRRVHILGHSMGSSLAAILGCADEKVGKVVLVCPSFVNRQMNLPARVILKICAPFTCKVRCKWHASSKYHLHYENAPCDEQYLGHEYFRWFFTRRLFDYYKLNKRALKAVTESEHEHLLIVPDKDEVISKPSAELYVRSGGNAGNVIYIENGTHSVFYDKDPNAEEAAVQAILEFAKAGDK